MPPSSEPDFDLRQRIAAIPDRHVSSAPVPILATNAHVFAAALAALTLVARAADAQPATPDATPRSVRITMEALHQLGGVPPGWVFSPPAGDTERGKVLFERFGCHTCHAVQGANLPPPTGAGPDLSGMGAHHPAAYFAESIVNPAAVVVDGPGYIAADGRSTMPAYPDMTLGQLADLVAFLRSLRSGGAEHLALPTVGPGSVANPELPAPPASGERRFLVQSYQIRAGQLAAFEAWFASEGRAQLLAEPGVIGADTFVDRTCGTPRLVTIFTFADPAAFMRFTRSPSADQLGQRFDDFIGLHGHDLHTRPPIYRSEALSARAEPTSKDSGIGK